jgi:N-acetylglutamate synthase-like GNAT family acetyltransferase
MITYNDKTYKIRDFNKGDIEWIIKRHDTLYNEEYGFDETFKNYVSGSLKKFVKDFDSDKENIWIAEVNSKAVGIIAIAKIDNERAQLRWFLIEPYMRGKGLGRDLINVAIEFCKQKNYKNAMLWTVSILSAARHLYKSFGFTIIETIEHEIWGKSLIEEKWYLSLE